MRLRLPTAPAPAGALDVVLGRNVHGLYCVPRHALHRPAAAAVVLGKEYEAKTIAFLAGLRPEADIVHAGTFFGDFLPALANSRTDGARVWAFEPNPESFRCAQITVLLNQLTNVVLAEAALGDFDSRGTLATTGPAGRSLGGGSYLTSGTGVPVHVRAIDSAVPGDVEVAAIHLDVEGHELSALNGAEKTIARCRPLLVLETSPLDWLKDHGYHPTMSMRRNTVFSPE